MSEGATEGDGSGTRDDDLRMGLYELLHERAAAERRWQFWRLAAGHLAVGAVVVVAFLFDLRFIALTPVLYGVVVMDALKTSVSRLYLQQRLVELEAKLADREPLFAWVSDYGVFGRGDRIEYGDLDLNTVPRTALFALIGSIYLGLIAASLLVWSPLDSPAGGVAVPVTRELLLLGYTSFSLLFAGILFVGYLHYQRVRDRVLEVLDAERPAGGVE